MSGIEEEKSVTNVIISHGCITVGITVCIGVYECVGSSVRDPAVRSHMLVQSGRDGYKCF